MNAANLIAFPNEYERRKALVDATIETMKQSVIAHVKAVNELKLSGTWAAHADSWPSYCAEYLPFKAKTYSAYTPEIPFAELIESISGFSPTPNQARPVRESLDKICLDPTLTAQTYDHAFRATGNPLPSKSQLEESYQVVARADKNQVVEFEGESYRATDAITMAVAESIHERQMRQKMHIADNAPSQKWTATIESFEMQKAIQALLPQGMKAPAIGSTVTLLWRKEAE